MGKTFKESQSWTDNRRRDKKQRVPARRPDTSGFEGWDGIEFAPTRRGKNASDRRK